MGSVLLFAAAGLLGFLLGAYLAAAGDKQVGVALMGAGLVFQLLSLRQLKMLKKGDGNAR